jgi:hypothetical protein
MFNIIDARDWSALPRLSVNQALTVVRQAQELFRVSWFTILYQINKMKQRENIYPYWKLSYANLKSPRKTAFLPKLFVKRKNL